MKAVKRQTRSREVENEQNEINERKKARLSSDSSATSKKKHVPVSEETSASVSATHNMETNGDSNSPPELEQMGPEPKVTKFPEPKTSTPIVQNGAVSNLSPKFHNNSALPEVIPFTSPDVMSEVDLLDSDILERSEIKDVHNGLDGETESLASTSHDSANSGKGANSGEKSDPGSVGEIDAPKPAGREPVIPEESKCDVELFLSSLLQVSELEGHADVVNAVAADGDIIISASQDTTIKMWDPHKKQEVCNFQGHTGSVTSIILLTAEQAAILSAQMGFPDSTRIIISGSTDCSIRLWSAHEGLELLSIYTYNGITSLGYMEDKNYIAVGTDGGKLELWDLRFSKIMHSVVAHEGPVADLKVDDCFIYTTSPDGKVKVWLYEEDELQQIYCRNRKSPSASGEMQPAKWKCIACDQNNLYLGDNSSDIKVLDWKAGRIRMMRNQIQPNGVIEAVCAKKDVLLTSSFDACKTVGAVNVWQLPSMTYICTMSGDVGKVNSLALAEKNGILRVVSGGSKLMIWEYVCSKPASPGTEDKYFCREMECLGEETSLMSTDSSTSANSTHSDAVDGLSHSWKCILL